MAYRQEPVAAALVTEGLTNSRVDSVPIWSRLPRANSLLVVKRQQVLPFPAACRSYNRLLPICCRCTSASSIDGTTGQLLTASASSVAFSPPRQHPLQSHLWKPETYSSGKSSATTNPPQSLPFLHCATSLPIVVAPPPQRHREQRSTSRDRRLCSPKPDQQRGHAPSLCSIVTDPSLERTTSSSVSSVPKRSFTCCPSLPLAVTHHQEQLLLLSVGHLCRSQAVASCRCRTCSCRRKPVAGS
ncbi:hypothetical protein GW17_00040001 [Ensete ventricosum]|nr:hypothetical protein GW17_00040001 [Ensete ventricosum]